MGSYKGAGWALVYAKFYSMTLSSACRIPISLPVQGSPICSYFSRLVEYSQHFPKSSILDIPVHMLTHFHQKSYITRLAFVMDLVLPLQRLMDLLPQKQLRLVTTVCLIIMFFLTIQYTHSYMVVLILTSNIICSIRLNLFHNSSF